MKTRLTILGATGSIGASTLDVVSRHPDRYEIVALTGMRQLDKLLAACVRYAPRYAVVLDEAAAEALACQLRQVGSTTEVLCGNAALIKVATLPEVDAVMAAIVGAAGMPATLAAARAGKRVLLANKETLVLAGHLFMQAAQENAAILLPIDSEHNAIFQSLPHPYPGNLDAAGVRRLLLTASGGPFRTFSQAELEQVTPEQAVKHPKWSMGRKISVDSASLMNKGLEVIEAHWLFNAPHDRIKVVVHPQSVVHSLVEYVDGSVLAQLGSPDMRTPIANALAYPERIEAGVEQLDLFAVGRLDFEAPDLKRFPCLQLAFDALAAGGAAPAMLNAANEVAVAAFLERRIGFTAIPRLIEMAVERAVGMPSSSLEELLEADSLARELVEVRLPCC
ncbi:1-deoxy-D-xylulose 5-phosphate reductoisomerase [Formivibrio citricus]|uniref:1-deoxy-D-xylulose 5-phosphate reductoisomerase n=1 Tax=Formivibrio citricus TaxID=83765 RepID=A0A1I4XAZ9_9NEIS|nr:1-deoxy-D-xylulose-5-phosphate reductoisomerase [Formivibrio citricus]SFN22419.1 1-deoxy-D-xylulose 5-phosphate reductoisomerase [Formivibrio citricus]